MTSAQPAPSLTALLARLVARQDLSRDETRALLDAVFDDRIEPALLGAMLAALGTKGESVDELVGAAEAMRARVTAVRTPPGAHAIDTCGTGGDGQPLLNISTAVAIVCAAAGATVAKHGNRSNTRPSGSAEVLAELGVNVDADVPVLERCLREVRIAFLYAPRLHPAMKHAAAVRRALGVRTIFNLVGPLTNPAGVRRQVLGVSRPELVPTMLEALRQLGAERALVVHGLDGLCDLTIGAPSRVGWWDGQGTRVEEFDPQSIGVRRASLDALRVRSPAESAAFILAVLTGQRGPGRDVVELNAAAALWVAGLAADWQEGRAHAARAIDTGAADATLRTWATVSHASG